MMQRYRKQRGELGNIIMKCFVAVKPDHFLSSPLIIQLEQPVHFASGYRNVKQKPGYRAHPSQHLHTGAILRSQFGLHFQGSYKSHLKVKCRKWIPPVAFLQGYRRHIHSHGLPVTLGPGAMGESNLQPGTCAGEVHGTPLR